MVCDRCIRTVQRLAEASNIVTGYVRLGELEIANEPTTDQLIHFKTRLVEEGFELLDDQSSRLIEQVKILIINEIHHSASNKSDAENYSDFLARHTLHEYAPLSRLFSAVTGITIEKFIIAQKIERVKELLVYGEMSLGQIAFENGYSSTQHLSNQFKQVTGLTPSAFKSARRMHGRKAIDRI